MRGTLGTAAGLVLALALGAQTARSQALTPAVPVKAAELHTEVGDLKDAVASPLTTIETVNDRAFGLFSVGLPGTRIVVRPKLRGWDTEREIKGTPAEVDRLINSARKRISDLQASPPPHLAKANGYIVRMAGGGRMGYADDLDPEQMGVYRYLSKSLELGIIELNVALKHVAGKVGDVFAFATLVHEAAHAAAHQEGRLDPANVVEGEIDAFRAQYLWLKMIDPYGERLALIRSVLALEMKRHPNLLTKTALDYATSLHVLAGTGGDRQKIKDYVLHLGYDKHKHDDDHKNSRGEDAPTSA